MSFKAFDRALLALFILAGLCVSGCSSLSGDLALKQEAKSETMTAPTSLLLPVLGQKHFTLTQQLRAFRYENGLPIDRKDFVALLDVNEQKFTLALLTALGQRVWKIEYDGTSITQERSAFLPQQMKAQYLLNDITLCFWPERLAQSAGWRKEKLSEQAWLWYEPHGQEATYRIEVSPDQTLSGVPYRVQLMNLKDGYRLEILSQE